MSHRRAPVHKKKQSSQHFNTWQSKLSWGHLKQMQTNFAETLTKHTKRTKRIKKRKKHNKINKSSPKGSRKLRKPSTGWFSVFPRSSTKFHEVLKLKISSNFCQIFRRSTKFHEVRRSSTKFHEVPRTPPGCLGPLSFDPLKFFAFLWFSWLLVDFLALLVLFSAFSTI